MTDYGRAVQFGLFLSPERDKLDQTLAAAQTADAAGLELIGIQDHPYQQKFLDTWALMPVLLARTERITVFPDVASLPLRPPAVLAKTAASLDVISGGRFELGLGAGAFWEAISAMGGPHLSGGEAAEALTEAVEIIRLMWSAERSVRFTGTHYQISGVRPGPQPAHDMGIWLGVGGPRMLALVGRSADGWLPSNGYFPPEKLPDMHRRIDEAATNADRDPSTINRLYNVWGAITDGPTRGAFEGPVDQWTDTLTSLVLEGGMNGFLFGAAGDDPTQISVFIEEVVPAVREQLRSNRSNQGNEG